MNQSEMNLEAQNKFELKERELDTLVQFILSLNKEENSRYFDNDLFEESYDKWKKYRDSVGKYKATLVKGGTIHPLSKLTATTTITEEKIASVKEEFEILLRKNNYS